MRNLIHYPISRDEVAECLEDLSNDFTKEESMGDMRPLLLWIAAKMIRQSEHKMIDINLYR